MCPKLNRLIVLVTQIVLVTLFSVSAQSAYKTWRKGIESAVRGDFSYSKKQFNIALNQDKTYYTAKQSLMILKDFSQNRSDSLAVLHLFRGILAFTDAEIARSNMQGKDADGMDAMFGASSVIRNQADALNEFDSSMQIDSTYYMTHNFIGMVMAAKGDYSQAINLYAKAISLNSMSGEVYYNTATAYYFQNEIDSAKSYASLARLKGYSVPKEFLSALRSK